MRDRSNVVLFTVDDMNWDTPGCYGGPAEATLNVPPNPALIGGSFMFRWFAIDNSTIAEAFGVRVTI